MKLIANNKKARHEYFIEETFEAGLVLTGTEIKSIRKGGANIKEAYAEVDGEEVFIHGMHISPYEQGNRYNVDPIRTRKLLLRKREIKKLIGATTRQGYTLVPLRLYINDRGLAKLEIALAKGKKLHDKRRDMAKRDANRRIQQELARRQRD